jgi:hypothetical protein
MVSKTLRTLLHGKGTHSLWLMVSNHFVDQTLREEHPARHVERELMRVACKTGSATQFLKKLSDPTKATVQIGQWTPSANFLAPPVESHHRTLFAAKVWPSGALYCRLALVILLRLLIEIEGPDTLNRLRPQERVGIIEPQALRS